MDFISILSIFVLACFVGYYVVWSVTPALHTPLMSVTNAISSVIVVGALIAAAAAGSPSSKWLGLVAVALASVNIFGGFAVTQRMLSMYKKRERPGDRLCLRRRTRSPPGSCSPIWSPGVCFILALRGLSSPESEPSRQPDRHDRHGDRRGDHASDPSRSLRSRRSSAAMVDRSAAIGLVTARKIQMTAMPQLVAAFHSLVGMAAVLVGAAAYLNPEAFGIAVRVTPIASPSFVSIFPVSRIEMGLGVAIGAITFSGSVIAFLKLNGNMSGKPILLPLRHVINLGTLVGDPRPDRLLHAGPVAVGVLHRSPR